MFTAKRLFGYLATGVMPEMTALDESLTEHDKKYHPDGYKDGDICNKRETMAGGDGVDKVKKRGEGEQRKDSSSDRGNGVTAEEDAAYMDAVKRGDMETARRMVREAAAQAMRKPFKDDRGNVICLYHGSNRFGETVFDKRGMFFTTDSESRASGYGGPGQGIYRGFSHLRNIGIKNEFDENDTKNVVDHAKSVLGIDVKKATDKDRQAAFDKLQKEFMEYADRMNALDGNPFSGDESKFEFENGVSTIAYMFMFDDSDWESLNNAIKLGNQSENYVCKQLMRDIKGAHERYKSLRDEYQKELRDQYGDDARKFYDAFFAGYYVGDAMVDAEYSLRYVLDEKNDIIKSDGGFIDRKRLVNNIIESMDSGIYSLFVDAGQKPLVLDAKGAYWSSIAFNGKHMSTDSIGEWAKDNGYTSVRINNVLDPGVQNADASDFITFKPSQIKSADPVTYDDAGQPIPLSSRFDFTSDDIRY